MLLFNIWYVRMIYTGRIHHHQQQQQRKKAGGEEVMKVCSFSSRVGVTEEGKGKQEKWETMAAWGSKAMMESVEEVCRDIEWGERREVGRIGLVLQDYICRDLIEETVSELGFVPRPISSLPFDSCKRKLRF